jgi:hypothetical protein
MLDEHEEEAVRRRLVLSQFGHDVAAVRGKYAVVLGSVCVDDLNREILQVIAVQIIRDCSVKIFCVHIVFWYW